MTFNTLNFQQLYKKTPANASGQFTIFFQNVNKLSQSPISQLILVEVINSLFKQVIVVYIYIHKNRPSTLDLQQLYKTLHGTFSCKLQSFSLRALIIFHRPRHSIAHLQAYSR